MKLLLLILVSSLMQGLAAQAEASTSMTCTSFDHSVSLQYEVREVVDEDAPIPASGESALHLDLKIGSQWYEYIDDHGVRILELATGETVIRDWETGRTVLTFEKLPLLRSDRGSEQKIAITQSEHLSAPVILQCQSSTK